MSKPWTSINDDSPHGWDAEVVKRGVIPATEDGQAVFIDGAGNKTYFATASAAAATITLPPAPDTIGQQFTIKRKSATANALKIVASSGNVEATPTYTVANQYDCPTFESDGTNYWLVATVSTVDTSTLLSSASASAQITTSILNVVGSASFSRTANFKAGISVSGAANFLTTMSVSGDADFRSTMTVSGVASFKTSITVSATASVGALTIAGVPFTGSDYVKLFSGAITNTLTMTMSGSWSDYVAFDLKFLFKSSAQQFVEVALSNNGGTSDFLSGQINIGGTSATVGPFAGVVNIVGNGTNPGTKAIIGVALGAAGGTVAAAMGITATANTSIVNQIRFNTSAATKTMSAGWAYLYGLKG